MRKVIPEILEKSRLTTSEIGSKRGDRFGAFNIRMGPKRRLWVIFSDGEDICDWEHASVHVSYKNRFGKKNRQIPTWDDMCFIKNLFWDEDETVIQFHPKKIDYVNLNPYVLHLWKHKKQEHKLPPIALV